MVAVKMMSEELRAAGGADQRALAEQLRSQSTESLVRRPAFSARKSATESEEQIAARLTALEEWSKEFGKSAISGAMLARLRETGTAVLFEPVVVIDDEQRALGCVADGLRTFQVTGSGTFKLSSIFSRYRLGAVLEALARRGVEPAWFDKQMETLLHLPHR